MNKNIIVGVVSFVVGGAISGGLTYIFTKRKYEEILKNNTKKYDRLLNSSSIVNDVPVEYRRKSRVTNDPKAEEMPKISDDEKEIIKEKLRYNNRKTTDYASRYKTPIKDIIDEQAEKEDNEEVEEPTNISIFDAIKEAEEESTEKFEKYVKNMNRKPVIISEKDFIELCDGDEHWECENLYLYSDDIITTEDDKIIDPDELAASIGDCLDKYGFKSSKEKSIYVKNFKLNTVYEIVKQNRPFS